MVIESLHQEVSQLASQKKDLQQRLEESAAPTMPPSQTNPILGGQAYKQLEQLQIEKQALVTTIE